MEIIVNQESGAAYVRLREPTPDETPQKTRTFAKHGIAMEWNGKGELLGIVFAGNGEPVQMKIKSVGRPGSTDGIRPHMQMTPEDLKRKEETERLWLPN